MKIEEWERWKAYLRNPELTEEAWDNCAPVRYAVAATSGEKSIFFPSFVTVMGAVDCARALWVFLKNDLQNLTILGPYHPGTMQEYHSVPKRDMLSEFREMERQNAKA